MTAKETYVPYKIALLEILDNLSKLIIFFLLIVDDNLKQC